MEMSFTETNEPNEYITAQLNNPTGMNQNFEEQMQYQAGRYAEPEAGPPTMPGFSNNNFNVDPIANQMGQMGSPEGSKMYAGYGTQMGNQSMQQGMGQGMTQGMAQGMGQGMAQGMGQGMAPGQQFGAHELMEAHEVLTDHIDGINQFEMYRPNIKDQNLMQILDKQLGHMYNSYQNMANYLHAMGGAKAIPYRAPKGAGVKYGLRKPAAVQPNVSADEMDDRDVASGMLGCAKSSAILCMTASLECADYNLRSMMMDCAVSSSNQAYEIFQYMNQMGMYQVPTLEQQTMNTMANIYQAGTGPAM